MAVWLQLTLSLLYFSKSVSYLLTFNFYLFYDPCRLLSGRVGTWVSGWNLGPGSICGTRCRYVCSASVRVCACGGMSACCTVCVLCGSRRKSFVRCHHCDASDHSAHACLRLHPHTASWHRATAAPVLFRQRKRERKPLNCLNHWTFCMTIFPGENSLPCT